MYKSIDKDKVACMILSGGLSSRMENHKALLPFSDAHNFLQHIIEVYQQAGINKIIVIKNKEIDFSGFEIDKNGCLIVNNYFPGKGRLFSIQLGLSAMPYNEYCFIQNIDNPFVTSELIEQLATHKTSAGYVSPEYQGKGGHPVLVSATILRTIEGINDYTKTLRDVLSGFPRFRLMTDDVQCTRNINTKEDYEQYFSCLKNHIKA